MTIISKILSYPELKLGGPDHGARKRMSQASETKAFTVLRRPDYPMLVTFADVNRPASVAEVSPDNLAAHFGTGYALKRITFEALDSQMPLTTGFKDRFPAIASHRGNFRTKPLNTPRDQNLDDTLGASSFSAGVAK